MVEGKNSDTLFFSQFNYCLQHLFGVHRYVYILSNFGYFLHHFSSVALKMNLPLIWSRDIYCLFVILSTKWSNVDFKFLDIASVSLEQCEKRYKDMKARENPRRPLFSAEFIVADATKVIFLYLSHLWLDSLHRSFFC